MPSDSEITPTPTNYMLMPAKTTLSVSMIVKNEERHIGRALENLHIFADEIVVLDTGSSDRTREIASSMGARVPEFTWIDDFACARNMSLSYCSQSLVMWLDADDVITPEDAKHLRELLSSPIDWDVLYLPYVVGTALRKKTPRIFRNGVGIRWIYPIHEILQYPPGLKKRRNVEDICVYHRPLREATANSGRNLRIMLKAAERPEFANTNYMHWHIAKEYSGLRDYSLAIHYFEQAIARTSPTDGLVLSREYLGLARQYRRLGQPLRAMGPLANAALAYPNWREPYCGLAELYWELGDDLAAKACVSAARQIRRHDLTVEQNQLYESEHFQSKFIDRSERLIESTQSVAATRTPVCCRVMAGGDVCLGRQMEGLVSKHGSAWPFAEIRELFTSADIGFVNLECVVSRQGSLRAKGGQRPFYYRALPALLDVLYDGGINAVTTANNHSLDFGADALLEQKALLAEHGYGACGAGQDLFDAAMPLFIQCGANVVAFIGIDTEEVTAAANPSRAGINHAKRPTAVMSRLIPAIALARTRADFVVVTPHWGDNWQERPSESRRELAREIIGFFAKGWGGGGVSRRVWSVCGGV